MDSSLLDRRVLGRRAQPDHRALRFRAKGSDRARARARPSARTPGRWRRPLSLIAVLAHAGWAFIWCHRRLRATVLSALIVLPLLFGGWRWLRDSSLVSVQQVRLSGVQGPDARAVEAALTAAARRMSTLDVRPAALRAAVAAFPVVRDLRAAPSFPHGLRIRVLEQPPVAALTVHGQRTAVAADGVVLGPALLSSSLPVLDAGFQPLPGQMVRASSLLAALRVLGAAPRALAREVARAFAGWKGLTMVMRGGLLVYFGDAGLAHAKWLSLARVLLAPGATGASYVDVRVPGRPVAGFAEGGGGEAHTSGGEPASAANPATAADLAAGLRAAVEGGASAGSPTHTEEGSSGAGAAETSAGARAETAAGARAETAAGAAAQGAPAGSAQAAPAAGGEASEASPAAGG